MLGKDSGRAWNTSLTMDDSDYYNVAIGTLAFTDGKEEAFAVGSTDAQGAARRELYVGEIAQKTGESEEEFRARATAQADATLAARLLRTTIIADISPADYGRPYLVGDLVRVQVGPVTIKKRITGATWLLDQTNDKISLTLGDQLNTVVAEIEEQEKASAAKASSASIRAGGAAKTAAENKGAIVGIKSDFKALIAKVDGLVAGMDAYVLEKVFEDYKLAAANLFAALEDEDETIKSELSLQASSIEGLQEASAELTTRVSGAETALEMVSLDVGDLQEASAEITARVDFAETSLKQKAEKSVVDDLDGRVKTVETAQASLGTRVDDAETALDQKAEKTAVEDLDGRVSTVETAQTSLTTRVSGAETALEMVSRDVGDLQEASAEISARVDLAEQSIDGKASKQELQAGLSAKVSNTDLANALKNYALLSALGDYLTVNAAAEQYVTSDGVTSIIGNYIVTDKDGAKKSLAQILADQISLQGRIDLSGHVSVSDGQLTVLGNLVAAKSFQIGTDSFYIAGNKYTPTQITSTSGAVLALGIA